MGVRALPVPPFFGFAVAVLGPHYAQFMLSARLVVAVLMVTVGSGPSGGQVDGAVRERTGEMCLGDLGKPLAPRDNPLGRFVQVRTDRTAEKCPPLPVPGDSSPNPLTPSMAHRAPAW